MLGIEELNIPWNNIESLYTFSMHWAQPKQLGIRVKDFSSLRELIIKNKTGGFFGKVSKLFYINKHVANLSRWKFKIDILLSYQTMDRSAENFARLLHSYM